MNKKIIKEYFLLSIILVLAFILRLYKIDIPLADHHSWRQADSAAVIRNLATHKFDLFRPRKDNLMPVSTQNLPNPERFFFEDFPLAYDVYPAILYKIFGVKENLARLVSVFFSLGTIFFLFKLVRLWFNFKTAILAAIFYSILPFSVFHSRVIMQEPAMIFYLITSIYFLSQWFFKKKENSKHKWLLVFSALLFSLALLAKVYSLFFLPLTFYLFWQKRKGGVFKDKYFYVYLLVTLLPLALWWFWVMKHPEGLPYSTWLLNEGNIRFKGAWFYWLFAERVGKLILGLWGLPLFVVGLILRSPKAGHFFHLWFLCVILFFIVFAKGNITHEYYQYTFVPVASVFLAKGLSFLLEVPIRYFDKAATYFLSLVCVLFMLAFSWYFVRSFYDLKGGVDLAGVVVNDLTPKESLIIAGDGADPSLLYNTNRLGWTVGFGSLLENRPETIEKLITEGADFYVTTKMAEIKSSDFGRFMYDKFSVAKETNQFVLFDLKSL